MECLSSSVDICSGENHNCCSEAPDDAGPAIKEIRSRVTAAADQISRLRAENARLSEQLLGVREGSLREGRELKELLEAEIERLGTELEAAEAARSGAEAEKDAVEAEREDLRAAQKALKEEIARLRERLDRATEELGEKTKMLLVVRRRFEISDRERATERDSRLQFKTENDLQRARCRSLVAQLQAQESEKRRLQDNLRFHLRVREQEQRQMQLLIGKPTSDVLLERLIAQHEEEAHEVRKEAEREAEAVERALHRAYDEKFQEVLSVCSSSREIDLLKAQNRQLLKNVERLNGKVAELTAQNEHFRSQMADKSLASEVIRGEPMASEYQSPKDLESASKRMHRLSEDAARFARSRAELVRLLNVMRTSMPVENVQDPDGKAILDRSSKQADSFERDGSSDEEQPTPDNPEQLKWTSNAAYQKRTNRQKSPLQKSNGAEVANSISKKL